MCACSARMCTRTCLCVSLFGQPFFENISSQLQSSEHLELSLDVYCFVGVFWRSLAHHKAAPKLPDLNVTSSAVFRQSIPKMLQIHFGSARSSENLSFLVKKKKRRMNSLHQILVRLHFYATSNAVLYRWLVLVGMKLVGCSDDTLFYRLWQKTFEDKVSSRSVRGQVNRREDTSCVLHCP